MRRYDPRDLALLPPFCRYTQDFRDKLPAGSNRIDADRYASALGPTFWHLHHYCWGLIAANRGLLLARSELARQRYLSDAVREFDYVLERSPPDFVLVPEILARRGQVLLQLGMTPAGLESLERAIAVKPDYWPAYAHAFDFFKRSGDTARARGWLERGLAATGEAPALTSRLAEIDTAPIGRAAKP